MQRGRGFVRGNPQQSLHLLARGNLSGADALVVGAQNLGGAAHLLRLAFDFDVVVSKSGGNAQRGFKELQVFIEGAEELVDPSGHSHCLLRQVWQACRLRRTISLPSGSVTRRARRGQGEPRMGSRVRFR